MRKIIIPVILVIALTLARGSALAVQVEPLQQRSYNEVRYMLDYLSYQPYSSELISIVVRDNSLLQLVGIRIAALLLFFIPVILLIVFWFKNKRLSWIAIPITVALDSFLYAPMLILSWGHQSVGVLAILVSKLMVITIVSLIFMKKARKKNLS